VKGGVVVRAVDTDKDVEGRGEVVLAVEGEEAGAEEARALTGGDEDGEGHGGVIGPMGAKGERGTGEVSENFAGGMKGAGVGDDEGRARGRVA
jgi:hypothetical protein